MLSHLNNPVSKCQNKQKNGHGKYRHFPVRSFCLSALQKSENFLYYPGTTATETAVHKIPVFLLFLVETIDKYVLVLNEIIN